MTFFCLIDCLVQKNSETERDQYGNLINLLNLRAKSGETYESNYDLCAIANAPGELPYFEVTSAAPVRQTRGRGYVSQPPPVAAPVAPPVVQEPPIVREPPVIRPTPTPKRK